jgi:hypothetical protein
MKAEKPVKVEVIAYAPVAFFHCRHCELVWNEAGAAKNIHEEQLATSLPDDLKQEYQQLSDWVREMVATFGERITFRVIDAASLEGWWKSLRYRVHKYPAIIVNGEEKVTGCGRLEQATAAIRQRTEVARLA